MKDGEMELMVHRRLLDDDAFGVGEPLNETAFGMGLVARGKHFLIHRYRISSHWGVVKFILGLVILPQKNAISIVNIVLSAKNYYCNL